MTDDDIRNICGLPANGEGHHPGDPDCICDKLKQVRDPLMERIQILTVGHENIAMRCERIVTYIVRHLGVKVE